MSVPDAPTHSKTRSWIRLGILAAIILALTIAGFFIPLPSVEEIQETAASAGAWGVVGFALAYAVLSLTPAPKAVLSVVAGVVWGMFWGSLAVYVGALAGAAASFALSRALGRETVERFAGARVQTVERAIRDRGLAAMIGARLVPLVPFTALNFLAGLTSVRTRDYAWGTVIGILPGTLAFVGVGAYGFTLDWPFFVALGVLGALTIAGAVWGWRAKKKSATDVPPPEPPGNPAIAGAEHDTAP